MSLAATLLGMSAILVLSGAADGLLARTGKTAKQAMAMLVVLFIGSLFPLIPVGHVRISVGGVILPLAVCAEEMRHGSVRETAVIVLGALGSALLLMLGSLIFPGAFEGNVSLSDLMTALCAGMLCALLLRDAWGSCLGSCIAVILFDLFQCTAQWLQGQEMILMLGRSSLTDMVVTSGLTGLLAADAAAVLIQAVQRYRTAGRTR